MKQQHKLLHRKLYKQNDILVLYNILDEQKW